MNVGDEIKVLECVALSSGKVAEPELTYRVKSISDEGVEVECLEGFSGGLLPPGTHYAVVSPNFEIVGEPGKNLMRACASEPLEGEPSCDRHGIPRGVSVQKTQELIAARENFGIDWVVDPAALADLWKPAENATVWTKAPMYYIVASELCLSGANEFSERGISEILAKSVWLKRRFGTKGFAAFLESANKLRKLGFLFECRPKDSWNPPKVEASVDPPPAEVEKPPKKGAFLIGRCKNCGEKWKSKKVETLTCSCGSEVELAAAAGASNG
jgi:hypothetical protein